MKYINLMGPMSGIDHAIKNYAAKYEIQLEYTLRELTNEEGLTAINDVDPYAEILKTTEKFLPLLDEWGHSAEIIDIGEEEAKTVLHMASRHLEGVMAHITELEKKKELYKKTSEKLGFFINLDLDIELLDKFEYFGYEFGKMPYASYKQFQSFLYRDAEVILDLAGSDKEYVYGVYYCPKFMKDRIDSIFSSLHFEKIQLPQMIEGEKLTGTPLKNYGQMMDRVKELDEEIYDEKEKIKEIDLIDESNRAEFSKVVSSIIKLRELSRQFEYRKYAAKTANDFFIFVGWMTAKEAEKLDREQSGDESVVFIIEDENESIITDPPTKFKNISIFKPFEFFVKMYGVPAYDELDPTPFLAITYTLLFGVMFGDMGQGLVLVLLGLALHLKKKAALGPVLCVIGCSSIVFGALFGSVFGYEFHSLFAPSEKDNINTTLLTAVGAGIFLILVSMIFNFINCFRKKNLLKFLFDPSGLSGFLFYSVALYIVIAMLTGQRVPFIITLLAGVPLLALAFRHPITRMIEKKKPFEGNGIGLSLFELVIELFETLLSYFTNTVSFVRVGAFALSHASIMYVVWMLSETAAGTNNIMVIIFGNILVMALEGLIVGIQVLRLEFYEMFSRFYSGTGREFKPVNKAQKHRRSLAGKI